MARWDEVGDGCFRRRYESFDLNIGVVRGSDSLLVVDTRADLRQAEELLADLRVFGVPVRWVVNSHCHFDHVFGNQRFVERARGTYLDDAAVEVRDDLELWGHVGLAAALLDDEADLRAALRMRYGDEAGDEYDRVEITLPDHTVVDRQPLDLGDRSADLIHLGRGHTDNDLVVACPASGVVFAGDLIEESAPPAYGQDCHPLDWPGTADALVLLDAATYIPGHGDVMTAAAAAEQARELAIVASLLRELHSSGIPARDALHEARARWPFPVESLAEAVSRGYAELA